MTEEDIILETADDMAVVWQQWHENNLLALDVLRETAPTEEHRDALDKALQLFEELPFKKQYVLKPEYHDLVEDYES